MSNKSVITSENGIDFSETISLGGGDRPTHQFVRFGGQIEPNDPPGLTRILKKSGEQDATAIYMTVSTIHSNGRVIKHY